MATGLRTPPRYCTEVNIPPIPRHLPLKQVRYPVPQSDGKRKPVTVCIAAICQEISDPKIVLCADTKLDGSYAGSSDGNQKIGKLAFGWVDMMAGDWVRGKELHG